MRMHWSTTLADKVGAVAPQSECDTRGDPHPLVDTLADSLAEGDVETLGDRVSVTHAMVKSLADAVAEVAP